MLRINRVMCHLVPAFAALLFVAHPRPAEDGQTRKEIESVYAKRVSAIKEKNFKLLKSHETEDYSEKSKDGTLQNRQQADAEADQLFTMIEEVYEYSLKIERIEESTTNAVTVEIADSGRFRFSGSDGKSHEMLGRGRSRDVWVRTSQDWKLKYHEELDSSVKVDGKPIN
jgi:hypothetical protein